MTNRDRVEERRGAINHGPLVVLFKQRKCLLHKGAGERKRLPVANSSGNVLAQFCSEVFQFRDIRGLGDSSNLLNRIFVLAHGHLNLAVEVSYPLLSRKLSRSPLFNSPRGKLRPYIFG